MINKIRKPFLTSQSESSTWTPISKKAPRVLFFFFFPPEPPVPNSKKGKRNWESNGNPTKKKKKESLPNHPYLSTKLRKCHLVSHSATRISVSIRFMMDKRTHEIPKIPLSLFITSILSLSTPLDLCLIYLSLFITSILSLSLSLSLILSVLSRSLSLSLRASQLSKVSQILSFESTL